MNQIVTSAPSILLASTGRIDTASGTSTIHLLAAQLLTEKKFLYQRALRELPDSYDEASIADDGRDTEDEYEAQDDIPFHNVS